MTSLRRYSKRGLRLKANVAKHEQRRDAAHDAMLAALRAGRVHEARRHAAVVARAASEAREAREAVRRNTRAALEAMED